MDVGECAYQLTSPRCLTPFEAIMASLEAMGYYHIFKKLILACIKSTSFSVLVEGYSTKIFKASQGIRQGDPLSPLLFIIVLEILSRRLQACVEEGELELYNSTRTMVESHLAYANDIILFLSTDGEIFVYNKKDIGRFLLFFKANNE